MKRDFTYLSKDKITKIHAVEWIPDEQPKAILQICHGMDEYMGRYDDFANFMICHGFYVVGNDHLGHGQSVQDENHYGFFAHPNGNACVAGDILKLRQMTVEKYPDLPYFMLGHSMGSFLARQHIILYGEDMAGAIIMGTGSQSAAALKIAQTLASMEANFHGQMYRSKLIDKLAFGAYNKSFEPTRTSKDWLTKDTAIVDKYLADPLCTFMFTVNAYSNMFFNIEFDQDPSNIAKIPKDLPILLTSGACDPVGEFGKGVKRVYDDYKKAGITDVTMKFYPNDRHEILNELDRDRVYEDILGWLEARMK